LKNLHRPFVYGVLKNTQRDIRHRMTTGEPTERMLEEAADWLLRLQSMPTDSSVRAAFARWRGADPRHERAWTRMEKGWRLLGETAPRDRAKVVPLARRRTASRWRLGLGAVIAACLLLLFVPGLLRPFGSDYVTAAAELRQVTLEDGSVIELGPRTALDVRFAAGRRGVTLGEGEAFFEITPDAARPFAIRAGDAEITVVGTAFNVRLSPAAVTVAVRQGTVEVRAHDGAAALRLIAGDRIRIGRTGRAVVQDRVAIDEIGVWRDRQLFVDGATVAEVAEEIGRYRPGWIVVSDNRLGSQRVTGLFDLRDPDRALNALVRPFNGEVRRISPYLRILSGS
jgi:transmembrane sensor